MNFLSGAIPVMNPVMDLNHGARREHLPERASVFSVARGHCKKYQRAGNIFPSAPLSSLSLGGLQEIPVMNFLSGAIPLMNPVMDLNHGARREHLPERASVFFVGWSSRVAQ